MLYLCIVRFLNYKQDESTNINKRDGKKKGCFISRIPYFADNWLREKDHTSSISGLIISGLCLTIFSVDNFIIPSMVIILIFLTRKKRKV